MHQLLDQLAEVDRDQPLGRKLLVCPTFSVGRELLAALAKKQGAWVGWEATTLPGIADALTIGALSAARRRSGTDVELFAAFEAVLDAALDSATMHPSLGALAHDAGTRAAVFDAIQEVRIGGLDSAQIRSVSAPFSESVAQLLDGYLQELTEKRLADAGWIFEQALALIDEEFDRTFGTCQMLVLPSWSAAGLPAKLVQRLADRGARFLASHDAQWITPSPDTTVERFAPPIDAQIGKPKEIRATTGLHLVQFFQAVTPTEELLTVLRETLARNARFDDVEIACTNVDSYGIALEAIARRTGVRVTMLRGVPLSATRPGRALNRWLDWLESGFRASILRRALDAGDFFEPSTSGASMARELRKANIGWGRDATTRLATRLAVAAQEAADLEIPDLFTQQSETTREILVAQAALARLLFNLLSIAPVVRDASDADDVLTSCESVATATRRALGHIAIHDESERATVERVRERLDAIARGVRRTVTSREAIAFVRSELSGVRAWTTASATARPRRASGGHVHLTDLAHAGSTGRKHLFIVGLDADSMMGSIVPSSILPDGFRAQFPQALLTTEERRRLRARQLDAAVLSSGARLSLSFATASGSAGNDSGASHEFLEMWRRANSRPDASYVELREALGESRSAVPRIGDVALDARDLWLQLLQDPDDPALLRDAQSLVRMHRLHISRGMDAAHIRVASPTAGEWHGIVPHAAALDPRNSGRPISPSSLEAYAACPMRWFYRYGIAAFAPRDLEYDEARWLDESSRGSLLHEVYEAIARAGLHGDDKQGTNATAAIALLHSIAARWRETIPPPSKAIHAAELELLEEEVRFFVTDEHHRWSDEQWELVDGEMRFGERIRANLDLSDGSRIAIRGRVDRVDRVRGGLRVIDYKTGAVFQDWDDRVPFSGGRRLQLALYAKAVAQSLGEPVVRAEYRFSTSAGGGSEIPVDLSLVATAPELVSGIVGGGIL